MNTKIDAKSDTVAVVLDESELPRPVGLATAYRFLDRCWVTVERQPRGRLRIRLRGKRRLGAAALKALAREFESALTHEAARQRLAAGTEGLRLTMIAGALASDDASLALATLDAGRVDS